MPASRKKPAIRWLDSDKELIELINYRLTVLGAESPSLISLARTREGLARFIAHTTKHNAIFYIVR